MESFNKWFWSNFWPESETEIKPKSDKQDNEESKIIKKKPKRKRQRYVNRKIRARK